MNEENENQSATGQTRDGEPVPLETESALPEQRQHRWRRRCPRRRYRDRGDRFRRGDSQESSNSSSRDVGSASGDVGVETLDRAASGGRETVEGSGETGEQTQGEPEFGDGIIEISGKGFGFLRDQKRNFVQTPQDIFVTPRSEERRVGKECRFR